PSAPSYEACAQGTGTSSKLPRPFAKCSPLQNGRRVTADEAGRTGALPCVLDLPDASLQAEILECMEGPVEQGGLDALGNEHQPGPRIPGGPSTQVLWWMDNMLDA